MDVVVSTIPARLDRLRWSGWHRRVVFALGITWILDGLEASLVANLGPALEDPRALGLSPRAVGLANTVYLAGQVVGALLFGHLTDRLGRKRLVLVTLALYLAATALSGAAPDLPVFLVFRLFAGAGIGGEYSAINSAIDELVPARLRGRIDLAINGSYWLGVAVAAGLTTLLLDPHLVPVRLGWRLAFGVGAVLGLAVLVVRRHVPESPRWLLMHGFFEDAERTMVGIERQVSKVLTGRPSTSEGEVGDGRPREPPPAVPVPVPGATSWWHLAGVLAVRRRRRAALGLVLMLAQTFFYNGVFFSYGLVLRHDYGVPPDRVGLYALPFAGGNLMGPIVLGPLFDRWGRRTMIALTYAASGALLLASGALYLHGLLDALTQTAAWCVVFFFASSAASSAYLTVSELFPVEIRGRVIALFYAAATCAGAAAPALFGVIIEGGDRGALFAAYALASAGMIGAAIVAWGLAEDAEGRSLEELAR
jgi:MFS family permease